MARRVEPAVTDKRKPATRVKAGSLLAALKDVRDAAASRDVIPVLGHVLIEAGDGTIGITATDLDMWAARTLPSDDRDGPASREWLDAIRPFALCLPAKALAAVLGGFDADAMVTLTAPYGGGSAAPDGSATAGPAPEGDETRATIAAGRARFRLACLPVADFSGMPPMDGEHQFELPASRLDDALAVVRHAVSSEETRYYLNGVYTHVAQEAGRPQELRFAATDGHRLARLVQEVPDGAADLPPMIVPRRTVALLASLSDAAAKGGPEAMVQVEMDRGGTRARWTMPAADGGEVTVLAKAVDGQFPDYGRVIPSGATRWAVVNRAELVEAVRRMLRLAHKESRCVRAEFGSDRLCLSISNADVGDAREDLPCTLEGEAITIGFNGEFWLQALAALATDDVRIGMTDPAGPAAVLAAEEDDIGTARLVQVLMPMRV